MLFHQLETLRCADMHGRPSAFASIIGIGDALHARAGEENCRLGPICLKPATPYCTTESLSVLPPSDGADVLCGDERTAPESTDSDAARSR